MGRSTTATPPADAKLDGRRFRVAFSFTGERRSFVKEVADLLVTCFGEDEILYDKFHEAEFARSDLGFELPGLYSDQSDLVVAVICPDYSKKMWTSLEWREIHALIATGQDARTMLCRFERATMKGLNHLAGFVDLEGRSAQEIANLILQRLALSEGKPKKHYIELKPISVPPDSTRPHTKTLTLPPTFLAVPSYIGSHDFIGRTSELQTIDDWANAADTHALLLFEAIGGNGKSMLTWHWVKNNASVIRKDWAGQFWYSFYERGTTMEGFARHALAYITGVAPETLNKLRMPDLSEQLLAHLKAKPYLLVLDGLERALVAYNRFDAATMADEEADNATDQIGKRNPCDAINPDDDQFLRALSAVQPSKILVSSRLTPRVLINNANQPVPGVRREFLGGLRPADAEAMLRAQDVKGDSTEMQRYLVANCACHPLVIGAIAGLINRYMSKPGDFDAWADDASELGGARLNLAEPDLKQKKNHILRAAIKDASKAGRRLLSILALIHSGVDYPLLKALNPHVPPELAEVEEPSKPEEHRRWKRMSDEEKRKYTDAYPAQLEEYTAYQKAVQARLASTEYKSAEKELRATLQDLLQRGLLQHDRSANRYDLHPVVRGVARGDLNASEKAEFGKSVVDYFSAREHNPYVDARTMEDVADGVQLVRTYVEMGEMEAAAKVYWGDLSSALFFNLEASTEALSLLKPFFPDGWSVPPAGISQEMASSLMNGAFIALEEVRMQEESWSVVAPKIDIDLSQESLYKVNTTVRNAAFSLRNWNRLCASSRLWALALAMAEAMDDPEDVFLARYGTFMGLCTSGRYAQAQAIWDLLDPMGRDWNRAHYRPGSAEGVYAEFQFAKGDLTEDHLQRAQELATSGKNRGRIRYIHTLRGQWRAERGEWGHAATSLTEAVRMAREVRKVDAWSETLLVLANHHRGALHEARTEAQRLAALPRPAHRPLAELYLALGDRTEAIKLALAAYKEAWADGEPYVRRDELTKSAALLQRLGEAIPTLPPFDETKHPPFPWEADVLAAIEKIKREKAEKAAKEAAKAAKKSDVPDKK